MVAASLFTTQSATSDLVKIMRQIKASTPAQADFMIGSDSTGAVRAVFPVAGSQMRNVVPRPSTECTAMWPWCFRTME